MGRVQTSTRPDLETSFSSNYRCSDFVGRPLYRTDGGSFLFEGLDYACAGAGHCTNGVFSSGGRPRTKATCKDKRTLLASTKGLVGGAAQYTANGTNL